MARRPALRAIDAIERRGQLHQHALAGQELPVPARHTGHDARRVARVQSVAGADGSHRRRPRADGGAGLPRRDGERGRGYRCCRVRLRLCERPGGRGAVRAASDRRQEVGQMIANDRRLDRRLAMRVLLDRRDDLLLVTGLGSTTWDAAAVGDDPRNFYLWGAMGAAALVGLGLAIAQPARRVLVVTGDGEMLMGLGGLATIAVQRPPNLAIAVFDNGHYGETGMQPSHTEAGVDLVAVARACGIHETFEISDELGLRDFAARVHKSATTLFARVAIRADEPPRVLPPRDGVYLKNRFRHALGWEP